MRVVFKDGEVSAFELNSSDELGGSIDSRSPAGGDTFRALVAQGHVQNLSAEEWSERLRSNLVDFVAESRFGWGENRDVH